MIITCKQCDSVHFNVRWNDDAGHWEICCEGCGAIYELRTGVMVLKRSGGYKEPSNKHYGKSARGWMGQRSQFDLGDE